MQRLHAVRGWAWAMGVIGLVIIALSFVPGWLSHHRELQGEGYRTLTVGVTAWQLRSGSLPVLGGGVALLIAVGLLAVAVPRMRRLLMLGAALALGLLVAGAFPIAQEGHISRVAIGPSWALIGGLAGGAAMLLLAALGGGWRPSRALLGAAALVVLLVAAGGWAARAYQLGLLEGPSQHWAEGDHRRADGAHDLVLTLRDGTYRLGGWSGRMEPAGINVILTDDPACPSDRAMYRVRPAVGEGVLWEQVVDICAGGERRAELEGVWLSVSDGGG